MSERILPTPEDLRKILSYDPDTGALMWLVNQGRRAMAGSAAGSFDASRGYTRVFVDGVRMAAHRVAWAIHYGVWPDILIDHIDGNGANNAIANLRLATPGQNQQNRAVSRTSRSGIVGVSWNAKRRGWAAVIGSDHKRTHLGVYATKEAAAQAYHRAKWDAHPFHRLQVKRMASVAR